MDKGGGKPENLGVIARACILSNLNVTEKPLSHHMVQLTHLRTEGERINMPDSTTDYTVWSLL